MSEPSQDLLVVAVLTAKPGSEHVVGGALSELVPATREEAGCRSYDLYESATVAGAFVTVERWGEQADLDAHMSTPHVAAAFATAGEHLAEAPVIHVLRPLVVG